MNPKYPNRGTSLINGEMSGIVNWNDIRYPQMYILFKKMRSNFWIPQRISMSGDLKNWSELTDSEQEAFLRLIGMLATLDSKQTRAALEFMRYITDPTYVPILSILAEQEATHNESYSYVLSSLVPLHVQSKAFNDAKVDPLVIKRNSRVDELYQSFIDKPTPQSFFEALIACVVLEGINFYSAFTFFYNLARNQKMLGTSTMINYIQRDEMQHTYTFTQLVRYLLEEMPELNTEKNVNFIYDTLQEATEMEIEWSQSVLGDVKGIDLVELEGYIKKLCNRRLRALGLGDLYKGVDNSMPWMIAFDDAASGETKTDTFEQKSRAYKKVDEDNDIDYL